MIAISIKEEAKRIIDTLPDNTTWSDLMYEFYVRREIGAGIADLDSDRLKSHDEVKKLLTNKG